MVTLSERPSAQVAWPRTLVATTQTQPPQNTSILSIITCRAQEKTLAPSPGPQNQWTWGRFPDFSFFEREGMVQGTRKVGGMMNLGLRAHGSLPSPDASGAGWVLPAMVT